MNTRLSEVFEQAREEDRAALIGFIPAGFPTKSLCAKLMNAMVESGVDIIEVGYPYSDPVMDGPVIQEASEIALRNGFIAGDVFDLVKDSKAPTLVMTYWNPIERYGVEEFASALSLAGGVGCITPDLTIEEADEWLTAVESKNLGQVFVVAPSTNDFRLAQVTEKCTGFIYAASLMGVTGTRTSISSQATSLVERIRKITSQPIAVGLGVSNAIQAREVATFADGVIVGSAFIKAILSATNEQDAIERVRVLATELTTAVRRS